MIATVGLERIPAFLSFAGLLVLCSARSWALASDTTRREETAAVHYLQGEVDIGREMFRDILDIRFRDLSSVFPDPGGWPHDYEGYLAYERSVAESPEERSRIEEDYRLRLLEARGGALRLCSRTLESWEQAEIRLRVEDGLKTPMAVAGEIVAAVTRMLPCLPIVSASVEFTPLRPKQRAARAIESATEAYGSLLRHTVAFLRGTDLEGQRPPLLQMARQYADLPESVEEFDRQHPSLRKTFRIPARKKKPVIAPPPTPRRRRLDSEDPIVLLVDQLMRRTYEGDMGYVRSICVQGYWPEEQIQKGLEHIKGRSYLGAGTVYVRDIGDEEIEVSLDDMRTAGPDGEVKRGRTDLILRKTAEGEYKVSFFGSVGERKRSQEQGGGGQ